MDNNRFSHEQKAAAINACSTPAQKRKQRRPFVLAAVWIICILLGAIGLLAANKALEDKKMNSYSPHNYHMVLLGDRVYYEKDGLYAFDWTTGDTKRISAAKGTLYSTTDGLAYVTPQKEVWTLQNGSLVKTTEISDYDDTYSENISFIDIANNVLYWYSAKNYQEKEGKNYTEVHALNLANNEMEIFPLPEDSVHKENGEDRPVLSDNKLYYLSQSGALKALFLPTSEVQTICPAFASSRFLLKTETALFCEAWEGDEKGWGYYKMDFDGGHVTRFLDYRPSGPVVPYGGHLYYAGSLELQDGSEFGLLRADIETGAVEMAVSGNDVGGNIGSQEFLVFKDGVFYVDESRLGGGLYYYSFKTQEKVLVDTAFSQ